MLLEDYKTCVEANDWDALARLFTEDAVMDGNVPAWRYQQQGRDEIRGQYRQIYGRAPHQFVEFAVHDAGEVTVVEAAEVFMPGSPQELYARSVMLFELRDGLIDRQTFYCTGPWDLETVARHRASAPMLDSRQPS
jgi:ketosteroid isomerase-like protein